jgi:FAD/FMN-containing dehydrogenase
MISSTVGGWIANGGGAGIGSYEYGYINKNIVEVETITTEGIKKLIADGINLVYGMAGSTGLILKVKLKVRDSADDNYVAAAFSSLEDMIASFQQIQEKNLELWHAGYRNPHHVQLTHQALKIQANNHNREPSHESKIIPEDQFIALFVYPEKRGVKITNKLSDIINHFNGIVLPEKAAKLEWDETFYPLKLKRLGPSIIPSEVVINKERLSLLFEKTDDAMAGLRVNCGQETVLMRYLLSDERRFGFSLAFTRSLAFHNRAKQVSGKSYAIGMYFLSEAENVFSKDKLLKLYRYKNTVDPGHTMNLGKIFPTWLDKNSPMLKLSFIINIAKHLDSLILACTVLG